MPLLRSPLAGLDCVVLAGGLGTRLRPVIGEHQKVAVTIGGEAFISRLLRWLCDRGARRVVLAVGYQSSDVVKAVASHAHDLELVLSEEPQPLGTAGALCLACDHVVGRHFVALNGDSFFSADLGALRALHERTEAAVTLALARVADCSRFGIVSQAPDGHIRAFREKDPTRHGRAIVNAGVYLMERDIFADLPRNQPTSLERDVLPPLCEAGRVFGLATDGELVDIGTPESFMTAEDALISGGLR